MSVQPTGAALGAQVHGVDLRALDAEIFASIHRAWLDHQVLLFRDQQLTDEDLTSFSRQFGDLDEAPLQETGRRFVEGTSRDLCRLERRAGWRADRQPRIGLKRCGHTDMSYLPEPPIASALYSLEVPSHGGDTSFCSMYAAWDELPGPLQRRVEELRVKHDGTYNSGGYVRQGVTPTGDPRTSPGTFHPIVSSIRKQGAGSVSWPAAQRVHRRVVARRFERAAR
jgi:taurine dioxygenase